MFLELGFFFSVHIWYLVEYKTYINRENGRRERKAGIVHGEGKDFSFVPCVLKHNPLQGDRAILNLLSSP